MRVGPIEPTIQLLDRILVKVILKSEQKRDSQTIEEVYLS